MYPDRTSIQREQASPRFQEDDEPKGGLGPRDVLAGHLWHGVRGRPSEGAELEALPS